MGFGVAYRRAVTVAAHIVDDHRPCVTYILRIYIPRGLKLEA